MICVNEIIETSNQCIHIDIPIKAVGISIPQGPASEILIEKDVEKDMKAFELVVTPVPRGTLDLLGAILGIEGYGAQSGQMDIYVSALAFSTGPNG